MGDLSTRLWKTNKSMYAGSECTKEESGVYTVNAYSYWLPSSRTLLKISMTSGSKGIGYWRMERDRIPAMLGNLRLCQGIAFDRAFATIATLTNCESSVTTTTGKHLIHRPKVIDSSGRINYQKIEHNDDENKERRSIQFSICL
jgi:hypothetical protein